MGILILALSDAIQLQLHHYTLAVTACNKEFAYHSLEMIADYKSLLKEYFI